MPDPQERRKVGEKKRPERKNLKVYASLSGYSINAQDDMLHITFTIYGHPATTLSKIMDHVDNRKPVLLKIKTNIK